MLLWRGRGNLAEKLLLRKLAEQPLLHLDLLILFGRYLDAKARRLASSLRTLLVVKNKSRRLVTTASKARGRSSALDITFNVGKAGRLIPSLVVHGELRKSGAGACSTLMRISLPHLCFSLSLSHQLLLA